MKCLLIITERTPTPPEQNDLNSYHLVCSDLFEAAKKIEEFELNFGVLVSMTIVPLDRKL
jgi:hypothetical protein